MGWFTKDKVPETPGYGGSFDAWIADAYPASPNPVGFGHGAGMPSYQGGPPISPFHYVLTGGDNCLGIGVENEALVQPTSLPVDSIYGPRYNVLHSMAPQAPGYVKLNQQFVPVDLIANGVYFGGTFLLTSLSGGGNVAPGNS